MRLQKFVMDAIEAMGGVVVQTEYALCEAMLPEQWNRIFQGRTECRLAFDFEVAEENPGAEFVTFGSYIFEEILSAVRQYAVGSVRYADIESPSLHDSTGKIRKFLNLDSGHVMVKDEQVRYALWVELCFRATFISDERVEEFDRVWIDMDRGIVDPDMTSQKELLPFGDSPLQEQLPLANAIDLGEAMLTGYQHMKKKAESTGTILTDRHVLETEIRRITNYYDELTAETIKRSQRKGLSEAKVKELLDKVEATKLEKNKQLHDIEEKYTVRTEVELDHGLLYYVPVIIYQVETEFRRQAQQWQIRYNPLLKSFSVI